MVYTYRLCFHLVGTASESARAVTLLQAEWNNMMAVITVQEKQIEILEEKVSRLVNQKGFI